MGRSTSSCLKIIACGSDSTADNDDLEAPEIKGDKRGWSFRKRSARHRVLSNTVISEVPPPPPLVVKKEAPESTTEVHFEPATNTDIAEKVPIPQCADEKPQLPASVDMKQSDPEPLFDVKKESTVDFEMEESSIVLIQSAVRGLLAQRELLKLKNVIKLQAAVRGHLVRRHAAGTLRCVQAIVKMQALVRARRARALVECSLAENSIANGKPNDDAPKSKASDKADVKNKPSVSYVSIEKLLNNRFARQLLESTPKEKPINIKCDMSKQNSAWKWLERWMSVSSAEPSPDTDLTAEPPKSEKEDSLASQAETKDSLEVSLKPADSSYSRNETAATSDSYDNLITYGEEKIKLEEYQSDAPVVREITAPPVIEEMKPEHPKSDEVLASDDRPLTESAGAERSDPHGKPEMETQQPKCSLKRSASEELETEGKKSVSGSRKAANPAFLVAQSKFEELSSAANSAGVNNLSDGSELEIAISQEDSLSETKESKLVENSANDQTKVPVGGSECGTELSISSTLDSPDRYDGGKVECESDAKVPERESDCSTGCKDQNIEHESTVIPDSTLSNPAAELPEKISDGVVSGPANSIGETVAVQQEKVTSTDLQRETNTETVEQAHNGTLGDSPRSHITVPESQGTPASQVSVNMKGSKIDKTGSTSIHKRKSLSNKSPSSPYNDSGAGSVNKQSGKDQKSSKRRNSFGSAKPENGDQEPRESSSSSTLPHFMQATESARAKVHASNSPRSSPDVSDREVFIKKRQSQSGPDGKHGSPHIQRSMSEAQQGKRANGGPAQERKWLR